MEVQKLIEIVRNSLEEDPRTVRLGVRGIDEIPLELINLTTSNNYKIERFGLETNHLSTIPTEICNLKYLRYLNVSNNEFKKFPEALCLIPNLEILDISKNKIKKLPKDFGKLMSLKLLKISRNLIKKLPLYIADMKELQYLKIDNNPIQFPPKAIHIMPKGDDKEIMIPWLTKLKEYLRQHAVGRNSVEMDESDNSSNSENGIEKNIIARSKSLKKATSVDTYFHPIPNFQNSIIKTENEQMSSKLEKKRPNSKLILDSPITRRERSYSNDFDSESKNLRSTFVRTHSKSYSQDSISSHGSQNGTSEEYSSDFYFQKLTTLPLTDNLPMSGLSLREASRNILYALSQIHKAMCQFISFTGNERVFFTELNKTNTSIGQLSMRLQRFDTFSQKSAPDADHCVKLLSSCQENITNFKILLDLFNKRIRTLTQSPDNLRYSRTLLLMFHGAIVDIKFAWESILPLLNNNTPFTGIPTPFTGIPTPIRSKSISRSNSSSSNINGHSGLLSNGSSSHINGINISSTGISMTNNSRTDVTFPVSVFEQMLTKVDIATKWVENVGKHLGEHLENALGSSTDAPASPVKIKMKELKSHMKNVLDITRQLKKSILAARFSQSENLNIQLKVYSTTIVFLQATVKMSTLAKDISQEWRLSNKIMTGLGHVTKSNIELTNFLRAIECGELPVRTPQPPPPNEAESEKSDVLMVYNEDPTEYSNLTIDE
ncbi:RAM signaling pathway protein-domain-containing protein [Gigaspora margarita]|uniref:RAM signaling pathway protein-domain-containing protein n=1 Tax=Gigaspora margarita TaxID=4874 RepID=A0A8H4A8W5_GIGMA|nr:RAM signaling pathway protein-domain-containing protein [Gigaspora margarita]